MALQDMFASAEVKEKEKKLLTGFNKAIAALLALELPKEIVDPFMLELKKEFAKRRQEIHTGEINFDVDVTPAERKPRPAKEEKGNEGKEEIASPAVAGKKDDKKKNGHKGAEPVGEEKLF